MSDEASHGIVIILADLLHDKRGVSWPDTPVLVTKFVTQVYQCHVRDENWSQHNTNNVLFRNSKTGIELVWIQVFEQYCTPNRYK